MVVGDQQSQRCSRIIGRDESSDEESNNHGAFAVVTGIHEDCAGQVTKNSVVSDPSIVNNVPGINLTQSTSCSITIHTY